MLQRDGLQRIESTDAEVQLVPVVCTALAGVDRATQERERLRDERAGFQPLEMFSKSWIEEDPPVRWILTQSAPLVVPYRVNGVLRAKVQ